MFQKRLAHQNLLLERRFWPHRELMRYRIDEIHSPWVSAHAREPILRVQEGCQHCSCDLKPLVQFKQIGKGITIRYQFSSVARVPPNRPSSPPSLPPFTSFPFNRREEGKRPHHPRGGGGGEAPHTEYKKNNSTQHKREGKAQPLQRRSKRGRRRGAAPAIQSFSHFFFHSEPERPLMIDVFS